MPLRLYLPKLLILAWTVLAIHQVRAEELHPQAPSPSSPHPVVAEMVDKGFSLGEGAVVKLTPPLVSPEMSAEEQRAAMAALIGERVLDRYLEDRIVAPQKMVVKTEEKLGDAGVIRRVDQYFVAYADLKMIRDEGLLKDFMAKEKNQQDQEFEQYLERRDGAASAEQGGNAEFDVDDTTPYVYRYRFPLINKVVISGLIRGQSFASEGLMVESALSAEDLLEDSADPTIWQAIPRKAQGDDDLGPANPYRGLAGYMQVTELKFQPGALLLESHAVLVEPTGWFRGKPLLSTKLPLVGQENVRTFRRKLAAAKAQYQARGAADQ